MARSPHTRPARPLPARLIATIAAMSLGLALLLAPAADRAEAKKRGNCTPSVFSGLGKFGPRQPDHCWRPYSPDSPFNTRLPRAPRVVAASREIVGHLTEAGPLNYMVAGDPARDYGIPTYFADAGDPKYTVACAESTTWGPCDIEGMEIPVPPGAEPSGVWPLRDPDDFYDSHLTIVDQSSGWEYDLWDVRRLVGNRLVASYGGRTRIDGDGLGSDAVASRFGSLAGTIRPEELAAGRIRHALVLNVPCTKGHVWPALKGAMECSELGMSERGAPAVGQLFQLRISNRKLRRFPRWKRAILTAFKRYGAYVSDTTGVEDQWNLRIASSAHYESLGQADQFVKVARDAGIPAEDYNGNGHGEYWFDVGSEVDWSKLRVVAPPR